MPYSPNMEQAAQRHYRDGKKLLDGNCLDNAGYHFGLAAECAIKDRLVSAGVREDEDAYWKHFPDLRAIALQSISGRSAAPLRNLLSRATLLQGWHVRMRYAENGSVSRDRVEAWRADADEVIGLLF